MTLGSYLVLAGSPAALNPAMKRVYWIDVAVVAGLIVGLAVNLSASR